jgi:hypothetical protein
MTTLTIKITKNEDVPALEAVLKRMGFEFEVEEDDDDWGDLSDAEIEGIKAGLADSDAGRMHSHESVMARIKETLNQLKTKNG